MGGACSTYGCIQGFDEEIEGKGPLERPRRRLEDNIKRDLQEVEWGGVEGHGLDLSGLG